jgi:hypothetical protein
VSLKSFLIKEYVDFKSWKSKQRIVVFESDDWGSERTRDKDAVKQLMNLGDGFIPDRFSMLDSIASVEDLSMLFEVLTSVKDANGSAAKLTANVCTANPDFKKISDSGFQDFFYEPFYETILRRNSGQQILELWNTGLKNEIFIPQLHGREHVHALAWLYELRKNNIWLKKAFEHNCWGINYNKGGNHGRRNVMAALDLYGYEGEFEFQNKWILESANLFQEYFGYRSQTFIPPKYIWHSRILPVLKMAGINAVQGIAFQFEPTGNLNKKYKRKLNISGSKDDYGIFRITRNAYFEPASDPTKDWVNSCLASINNAFSKNIPAVIGSHRINYIGSLNAENRDTNLKSLSKLLKQIIQLWPDVVFMSSNQLLDVMKQK